MKEESKEMKLQFYTEEGRVKDMSKIMEIVLEGAIGAIVPQFFEKVLITKEEKGELGKAAALTKQAYDDLVVYSVERMDDGWDAKSVIKSDEYRKLKEQWVRAQDRYDELKAREFELRTELLKLNGKDIGAV